MRASRSANRITVTLEDGHRQQLEVIARQNGLKLAQVVRVAIAGFLRDPHRHTSVLDFSTESTDRPEATGKDGNQ